MISAMKSIDTLQIYERLKKVKTSDAQAKALAEILHELVEDQVATKNDVFMLQTDLKSTELSLQNDLKQTELRLQNELKQTELRLQNEIEKSKTSTIKWIIGWVTGLIVAQTGILMAFLQIQK